MSPVCGTCEKVVEKVIVREEEDIWDRSDNTKRDSDKKDTHKHVVVDMCENNENRIGMYGHFNDEEEKGNISDIKISSDKSL